VVRVLDVLEHQLPVGRHPLALVAEHAQLATVEDAVEPPQHARTQVVLERRHGVVVRREHHAVARRYGQLLEAVLAAVELGRHAALAIDALPERHRDQRPVELVAPLVVRAREVGRVAERLATHLGAPMRAPVGHHVHPAIVAPGHDHRALADLRQLVVARRRDLGLQRHIRPAGSLEDALQLRRVHVGVDVDPVRDP